MKATYKADKTNISELISNPKCWINNSDAVVLIKKRYKNKPKRER